MDTHPDPEIAASPQQTRRAWLILAGLSLTALSLSQEAPPDPLLGRLYELLTNNSLAPFGRGIGAALGAVALIFTLALAFLLGFGLRDAFKRRKANAAKRIFQNGQNSVASTTAIILVALALFLGLRYGSAYLADLQEEAARNGTHDEVSAEARQGSEPVIPAFAPLSAQEESADASVFFTRISALAFMCGVGAFLAKLAYRRLRPREPKAARADHPSEGLARGLALARERLHVGDRDADAIIGCYADMCELFQEGADASRKPLSAALTAREFEALLLSKGAGESQIHALTLLFEKARYSGLSCDAQDRRRASEALSALELRYRGSGAKSPGESAYG